MTGTIRDISPQDADAVVLWADWLRIHRDEIARWRPRALGEVSLGAAAYLAIDEHGHVLGAGRTPGAAIADVDSDTRRALATPQTAAHAFDLPAGLRVSDLLTSEVQIVSLHGGAALIAFIEKVRAIVI